MYWANSKKLSALKKNPLVVRYKKLNFIFFERSKLSKFSSELSKWFLFPPNTLKSRQYARFSNIVLLPEPFSPTKKVIGFVNSIFISCLKSGKLNGYLLVGLLFINKFFNTISDILLIY